MKDHWWHAHHINILVTTRIKFVAYIVLQKVEAQTYPRKQFLVEFITFDNQQSPISSITRAGLKQHDHKRISNIFMHSKQAIERWLFKNQY
jgi:hypothetical protein